MIYLDGKPLSDYGLYLLRGHMHPSPAITHKTIKIPGRAGEWNFGSETGSRPFNYPVGILEGDPTETQRKLNDFIKLLFDEFGKTREIELKHSYDPGKHYMVKFDGSIDPQRIFEYTEFFLPLVAHDPYKYSDELSEDVTWGSETITFEYDYLLGHEGLGGGVEVTGPTTIDIDVEGLAIKPIFEISGTANNLTISANGYSFTIPDFSDVEWEVDFEKYLVWKNGQETMIEIREFYLMPGRNEIEIEGNNINIDLRIKFRDKFN